MRPTYGNILDLGVAFDTIDHDILLNILSNTIGVSLSWLAAYLQHRQYTVSIAGKSSTDLRRPTEVCSRATTVYNIYDSSRVAT